MDIGEKRFDELDKESREQLLEEPIMVMLSARTSLVWSITLSGIVDTSVIVPC